ncbi:MAG: hypothetical protein FRX49_06452 [Trebouxia sp. A1-2]|nr:MAG: hypothetical protein FRX49_06452 [Trebouxia sp. A1-2]
MSSDPAKTDCREPHTRKMQRPNGPQHIRNYCIQKTNTFHYDFNAQAVRRRQKRLAASQPAPPPMFQQQAQPADGKHHVGLQASSHQPDHLQHQVKQSQAAKQDTEQLYGALLCAARDEIAAEIDAKLIAEEALAAEQSLAHKQEIRLKSVAEHQNLLETELREAHAKLTSAEKKKQQLSAQLITCKLCDDRCNNLRNQACTILRIMSIKQQEVEQAVTALQSKSIKFGNASIWGIVQLSPCIPEAFSTVRERKPRTGGRRHNALKL